MDIPTLPEMTNPQNFTLLADPGSSFLPWVLLFGGVAAFGIAAFLFMRTFQKVRERKEDQARQGYTPNAEARKKEANQLVKSVILPGATNLLGFFLVISSALAFGSLAEAAEKDELRVQGWLAAEHPDLEFGDEVLELLSFEPVADKAGDIWVLQEVSDGAGEYQLVEVSK